MDHLPLPAGITRFPVDVPVLCTFNYDRQGFSTYPESHGWDTKELQRGKFEQRDDLSQFLQTWLYFGLLSEVLNVEIHFQDFVRDGMLVTTPLSALIEEWKIRIRALNDEAKEEERTRVYDLLVQSAMVGRHLTPQNNSQPPISPELVFSMQVLVSTLYAAAMWIWKGDLAQFGGMINSWGNSSLVMERMYKDGWCPSTLGQFWSRMNAATMAYISMLGKPDESDHGICSWDVCKANNVVAGEYKTKHVSEKCDCPFLEVPQEEVRNNVREGLIPVLNFTNGSVSVHQGLEYVAISHVWKDGLGNIGHNSLPRCQLEMIANRVREVGCEYFWIDTICVPAERHLKAAALSTMDEVYRRAEKVLVLDASVRRASCQHSPLETFMRVFTCGWLTRLWTFQEGALAGPDHLRVVFADGIVPVDFAATEKILDSHRLAETWQDASSFVISQVPLATLGMLRTHSDPFLESKLSFASKLMMLWLGCRGRFVTDPGDEYIVFGTMLGFDSGKLYLLDRDERMKGLLDMQQEWPHTFLFADGPRLRTTGYQWAPASFLRSWPGQPGNPTENERLGVRTELGLVVSRYGYIFSHTEADCMMRSFSAKHQSSGEWFIFEFRPDCNPSDVLDWKELSPRKGVKVGCLIAERRTADNSKWGLLVMIRKEEDGTIYANFGCRLTVRHCTDPEINRWSDMLAPWARPDEETAQTQKLWPEQDCWEMFGRFEECSDEQKWCIG